MPVTESFEDAYTRLDALDRRSPLGPEDVERLATAAYLIGKDAESYDLLTRAHHAWLESGDEGRAARCAIWLGLRLLMEGQPAQASGWIGRARRLLDEGGHDTVERGYLLLPECFRHLSTGEYADACAAFTEAVRVGERFGDRDLIHLARQGRGRALIRLGRIDEGIALLDEVMVGVTAGEVSPVMVGSIYCSVIEACHEIFDLRRAQEWTGALGQWCASRPEVVPYRGHCLVRRAEILQLHGEWPDAMEEADKACEWLASSRGIGAAFYQRAELYRLRGEFARAEQAYGEASQAGRSPQPGLALLRFAQGQFDTAWTAICRAADDVTERGPRARMLAASVDIALARHDVAGARAASDALTQVSGELESPMLRAMAAQATGALLIEEGDPRGALTALKTAAAAWKEIDAPYEGARVRVLVAQACRAIGDHDAWRMEIDAARRIFERLGSAPDLARLAAIEGRRHVDTPGGLTAREIQVLRLVATGRTNRAIADELGISEKTVARHVSNIFTKLDVSSRAAAATYAWQHDLLGPHPTT